MTDVRCRRYFVHPSFNPAPRDSNRNHRCSMKDSAAMPVVVRAELSPCSSRQFSRAWADPKVYIGSESYITLSPFAPSGPTSKRDRHLSAERPAVARRALPPMRKGGGPRGRIAALPRDRSMAGICGSTMPPAAIAHGVRPHPVSSAPYARTAHLGRFGTHPSRSRVHPAPPLSLQNPLKLTRPCQLKPLPGAK
jgi:hypothetical protein